MPIPIYLPPCPEIGAGVHKWLFRCACLCRDEQIPVEEAREALVEMMTRPENPANEVIDTLRRVYEADNLEPSVRFPKFDESALAGLPNWEVPTTTPPGSATEALTALFPGDPLVCIGSSLSRCFTERLSDFTGLENAQFIVPSPMKQRTGVARNGKRSRRALESVGDRAYIVIEGDFEVETGGKSPKEACWAILGEMTRFRPLVCAVDSGGKSIHGWFRASGDEEDDLNFFRHAVRHGADSKTWTKNQLVRLPGGTRDNGRRQNILVWNL